MRRLFASLMTFGIMTASPAFAVMEDYPSVKLQGLDKSVGRTVTFEATVGSTIQYGPLYIKIHSCRKAPPIEKPESAAFLQIWEVPPGQKKSEWVFSGWMFASSPALSAMDHPVYDVWVLDCLGKEEPNEEAQKAETDQQADQTNLTPADGETDNPVQDSDIPTDSEAETGPEETPPAGEAPASEVQNSNPAPSETSQDTQNSGDAVRDGPADAEVPAGQDMPAERPFNPDTDYPVLPSVQPQAAKSAPIQEGDGGMTAYDFMKNQNTAPQPSPQAPKPLTPSAPQGMY